MAKQMNLEKEIFNILTDFIEFDKKKINMGKTAERLLLLFQRYAKELVPEERYKEGIVNGKIRAKVDRKFNECREEILESIENVK